MHAHRLIDIKCNGATTTKDQLLPVEQQPLPQHRISTSNSAGRFQSAYIAFASGWKCKGVERFMCVGEQGGLQHHRQFMGSSSATSKNGIRVGSK